MNSNEMWVYGGRLATIRAPRNPSQNRPLLSFIFMGGVGVGTFGGSSSFKSSSGHSLKIHGSETALVFYHLHNLLGRKERKIIFFRLERTWDPTSISQK